MLLPPTQRFSSRVQNYVRYRPSYPEAILGLLRSECGLGPDSTVADVGAGTGISTELLLRSGATVYAVEPNAEMRKAAEAALGSELRFHSVAATAEETSLSEGSVDLVVAGQAFHWFDQARARDEFARVLRPDGWVALMWNERLSSGTRFLDGYEGILATYSPEYAEVGHKRFDPETQKEFFRNGDMRTGTFANAQSFDFEGLVGRVLSSSYAPERGHENHEPMLEALRRLFDETQQNDRVEFLYETQVYYGQL